MLKPFDIFLKSNSNFKLILRFPRGTLENPKGFVSQIVKERCKTNYVYLVC